MHIEASINSGQFNSNTLLLFFIIIIIIYLFFHNYIGGGNAAIETWKGWWSGEGTAKGL